MLKHWVNLVDKIVKSMGQTFELNTASTVCRLNNSQITTLSRMLSAVNAQVFGVFTQLKSGGRLVLGVDFYPLSPTPTRATKLNKGFIL